MNHIDITEKRDRLRIHRSENIKRNLEILYMAPRSWNIFVRLSSPYQRGTDEVKFEPRRYITYIRTVTLYKIKVRPCILMNTEFNRFFMQIYRSVQDDSALF